MNLTPELLRQGEGKARRGHGKAYQDESVRRVAVRGRKDRAVGSALKSVVRECAM